MSSSSSTDFSEDLIPKLDPLACDIDYYDSVLEHKPLLKSPITVPKIHAGTSSLGRNIRRSDSPQNNHQQQHQIVSPPTSSPCNTCKSPSQFPKTNGSLYESLSLGRRCHCDKKNLRPSSSARPSTSSQNFDETLGSVSPSVSLPSPAWTGTAYDSFDDPLSGSRRSFRSVSDLSLTSSSGPTSPWGQVSTANTVQTVETSRQPEHYTR